MESKIPVKLQGQYYTQDMSALVSMGHTEDEATRIHYFSFLSNTDHIPLKLIEGSVSSADVAEELKYREIARQEIAKIEGKSYEPKAGKITLDARMTNIEADVFSMAVDHEERIIMMELGLTE